MRKGTSLPSCGGCCRGSLLGRPDVGVERVQLSLEGLLLAGQKQLAGLRRGMEGDRREGGGEHGLQEGEEEGKGETRASGGGRRGGGWGEG